MSVGHVSRQFEAAGIPTVVIVVKAFEAKLRQMHLPRLLLTHELMGRPMGPPHDKTRQLQVLETALDLLESASANSTILDME